MLKKIGLFFPITIFIIVSIVGFSLFKFYQPNHVNKFLIERVLGSKLPMTASEFYYFHYSSRPNITFFSSPSPSQTIFIKFKLPSYEYDEFITSLKETSNLEKRSPYTTFSNNQNWKQVIDRPPIKQRSKLLWWTPKSIENYPQYFYIDAPIIAVNILYDGEWIYIYGDALGGI